MNKYPPPSASLDGNVISRPERECLIPVVTNAPPILADTLVSSSAAKTAAAHMEEQDGRSWTVYIKWDVYVELDVDIIDIGVAEI